MSFKFATMHLIANVGQMILKTLENCGPHVDRIYIGYSPKLWGYKDHGMENMDNPSILKQSKWFDKITLVEGVWKYDEDERNAILEQARKDGMDYLIVQDTDEFYVDFKKTLIDGITDCPNKDYYKCDSNLLWYDYNYIILKKDGKMVHQPMECAVNLKTKELKFVRCRRPGGKSNLSCKMLPGLFLHAAYVRTASEMWAKINSWGHAHQMKNVKDWFENVWCAWNPGNANEITQLHYSRGGPCYKAVPYTLPDSLKYLGNS